MKKGIGKPARKGKAPQASSLDVSQNATPPSQNVPQIGLTKQQIDAAALVAEDAQTDEEIAASVGVDRRTLTRWKHDEDFIAEVRRLIEEYEKQILHVGIAQRRKRLDALNNRWHRMQKVIEARAVDPAHAVAAGGDTGLLVRDVKGAAGEIVEVFAVDTALLKEMRETEKQAAQEVGQWVEKIAETKPDGSQLTDDERIARAATLFDRARARRARRAPEKPE